MSKLRVLVLLFPWLLLLGGCGGDEETPEKTNEENKTEKSEASTPAEVTEEETEIPEEEPEPPDPNGVYLAVGEKLNGQPVYTTESKDNKGEGFFLWYDGSKWKVSDQQGGGSVVSSSSAKDINSDWANGGARTHPDQDLLKDATHFLAITYQGVSDYPNARRMFKAFLERYPDDPKAAEANLCLGDIVTSSLGPREQPSLEQIDSSRNYYIKARSLGPNDPRIVNDATFNEGDLLEQVAENPEVLAEKMFTEADSDKDESLSKAEYSSLRRLSDIPFSKADANEDDKVAFGELFDAITLFFYQETSKLFEEYKAKYQDLKGAQMSQATHRVGLAYEKQELPGKMLQEYSKDIEKFGNDPTSVGTDEILKIYREKYDLYSNKYKHTIALLNTLDGPNSTVQATLIDRRELIPWLNKEFPGVDVDVRNHVMSYRVAIKNQSDNEKSWIARKLKEFEGYNNQFDPNGDLAPEKKFRQLLSAAQNAGQKTFELRMLWILDEIGADIPPQSPSSDDFNDASPSVLLWMGRSLAKDGRSDIATQALRKIVQNFPGSGGFVFDALVELGDIEFEKKKFGIAEQYYIQAYGHFSYHPRVFEAQIKLGNARLQLGKANNDSAKLIEAESTLDEVMQDDRLTIAARKVRPYDFSLNSNLRIGENITVFPRAEALYLMGQCRDSKREYVEAADYYSQVYNGFPSAKEWVKKSFEAASSCFDRLGDTDASASLRAKKEAWEEKFDSK